MFWDRAIDGAGQNLMWRWLRLVLGLAQMWLAAAGLGLLLIAGLRPITWLFLIAASAATVISRLLYRGRRTPRLHER
ncbi:MAG TPA: hypothetical protein VLM38_24225 [Blastocatellia bacterium]|nr:hypothetical protein [Blastocatellia bacterium]